MKEQIEFFDTDFLGNKIEIGDKVIFETPKYRDFAIGIVISKAPKSCQVEYLSFNTKSKATVRQYYEQLIKYPFKEGKWIFKEYSEDTYTNLTRIYECSLCGRTIECLNEADEPYCHCGAKMFKEAE